MPRFHAWILIGSALLLSWLLMQAIHEMGHVLGAWFTVGTVRRVVLHPLTISQTMVEPNPQPLMVAWAGPIFGALTPLVIWAIAAATQLRQAWLLQFFGGFCLLANGLYLGCGSFGGVGDAGDIVRHGSPIWTLWLFGLVCAPAGLCLWNGLGPKFGLGKDAEAVHRGLAFRCLGALIVTVATLLLISG